jgi:lipopolysaccharide transport system ATP-binding protein
MIKVTSVGKKYWMNESLKERLHRMLSFQRERKILWAVQDVSFSIQPGEIVGVIGHNGSGKSTLLKLISRVTEPTEGAIEITGRVGALLEVGVGMHPELSGRDNIYFFGALLGMKKKEIQKRLDLIVDFAKISSFLDHPIKKYSSGMALRLASSVILHLDTDILILDEVLSVGDKGFQEQCFEKIQEVAGRGKIVLCVSHHAEWIKKYCHRELLLDRGKLISDTKNSSCP